MQNQPAAQPFGVVLEGLPMLTFEAVEDYMACSVPNPGNYGNISIFLTQVIPNDQACKLLIKRLFILLYPSLHYGRVSYRCCEPQAIRYYPYKFSA